MKSAFCFDMHSQAPDTKPNRMAKTVTVARVFMASRAKRRIPHAKVQNMMMLTTPKYLKAKPGAIRPAKDALFRMVI